MLAISRSYLDRIVEALLMCLFVAAPARISLAQTTKGAIFGTVTDVSGAVVPGASVTVTAVATAQARVVRSGADGTYVVPLLFPGQYKVRGEKVGFEPLVVGPMDVAVDARQQLDLRLALAGTQQQVTVSGKAPLIETGGAAVGQVINQKTVLDMPLNGRNFLQLVLLSAGASPLGPVSDSQSFGRPSVRFARRGRFSLD